MKNGFRFVKGGLRERKPLSFFYEIFWVHSIWFGRLGRDCERWHADCGWTSPAGTCLDKQRDGIADALASALSASGSSAIMPTIFLLESRFFRGFAAENRRDPRRASLQHPRRPRIRLAGWLLWPASHSFLIACSSNSWERKIG